MIAELNAAPPPTEDTEDEKVDPDKFFRVPNRVARRRFPAGEPQPRRSRIRRKARKPRTGGWK